MRGKAPLLMNEWTSERLQIESEHEDPGSDFPLVGCNRADSMEKRGTHVW